MVLGAAALEWSRRGHANLRIALAAWAVVPSAVAAILLVVAIPEAATEVAGDLCGVARGDLAGAVALARLGVVCLPRRKSPRCWRSLSA